MKKDLCLKRFLLDKRRFADVINGFIGGGETLILPEDLSLLGAQSESTRTQKYRDRLTQAAKGRDSRRVAVWVRENGSAKALRYDRLIFWRGVGWSDESS